ncbi:TonB-dependent receptor [uncultured Paludibaculum sp.]|uniref:TonB-dependent receptor n=1 Tax=uncultured Paludibaculum sp. TaxID=1765020 RepID=UPI002AABFF69|nr:TonB-dependent receptor [uncultured Paludibaculum sp.]
MSQPSRNVLRQIRFLFALTATVVALTISQPRLAAQTQNAELNGTVTDQVGALVPGAQILVINLDTQVPRAVESNVSGVFVAANLNPGRYQVKVRKQGFQESVVSDVTLDVNQRATLNFKLTLGAVSDSVQVSAEAASLEASNAQLGTVITQEKITDLPLNGRNFTQLLTLTPGATPVSVGQNSGGGQVQRVGTIVFPAINGQSNRSNSFTLDGVYNNAPWMGTYALAPNVDALTQFKVQSHSDQAEFGGVSGGVVNILTRGGTNQFHGGVYEFVRNDALDARGFFTASKPVLRQNQFGANLGGPILRDKTFFFFSYEGYRQKNTSSALTVVPTADQLGGNFSSSSRAIFDPFSTRPDPSNASKYLRDPFPSNRIPTSMLNSSIQQWAKAILPAPIDTGNPAYNSRNTAAQTFPADQYSLRVDHNFSQSDILWARYSWGTQDVSSAQVIPGVQNVIERPAKNAGLGYTHLFGPNTLLTGLFGYSGLTENSVPFLSSRNMFDEGLFKGFPARTGLTAPGIAVPSTWGSLTSRVDFLGPQEGYQYRGDLSLIRGRHNLKFGGEAVRQLFADDTYDGNFAFNSIQTADLNSPGTTGNDLASFVLGLHDTWEYRNRAYKYESQLWSFYAQDSWKVTSALTVNFGLRWDLLRNPAFSLNYPSTWDFNTGQFIVGSAKPPACSGTQVAPCLPDPSSAYVSQYVRFTGSSKIRDDDYKMFGPRLGVAYMVRPNWVVRAGAGLFYDLQAGVMQQAQNASGAWPSTNLIRGVNQNRTTVQATINDPFNGVDPRVPTATPENASAFFFDPNFRNPRSLQWNLEMQRDLKGIVNLTLGYVGSHNVFSPVSGNYNTALTPGPGAVRARALWPNAPVTNYDRSIGRSGYHGLQVKAEQRFARGLSYLVSYTWSKSMDLASSGQFGVESQSLQNPYDVDADRSVSGYDIPHNFTAALVYQLPFGPGQRWISSGLASRIAGSWQMNTIVGLRSGQPYSLAMGVDVANIGANTTRPNQVGDPHLANPTPEAWFSKSAYASPATYTFGTSGRNQLRTDGFENLDLSLFREDRITERVHAQLRVEMFNLLNHPTFGIPQTTFTSPQFGRVSSTISTARQIQLGLKVMF